MKIKKDLIVLDVGANIGLFTQYVSEYAKQVYSIEPSDIHSRALNKLVTFNQLKNVTTIKKHYQIKMVKLLFITIQM